MILIKIGGGKTINLEGIIKDLTELGEPFIIVHGANALRDDLARNLGIPKITIQSISGYSSIFSDQKTIDLLMMAYSGLKNKRIVELCQQHGINAVGLSGIDGKTIRGKRNRGIKIMDEGKKKIVRDFSGKPEEINVEFLQLLLRNNYTPVLSVPIIDEMNMAINSENDDIINVIQRAFFAHKIIQLIEAPGLLKNSSDSDSWVKTVSKEELILWEEQAEGRFKRKILAIRKLLKTGAPTVIIGDGRTEHPIKDILNGGGTQIK